MGYIKWWGVLRLVNSKMRLEQLIALREYGHHGFLNDKYRIEVAGFKPTALCCTNRKPRTIHTLHYICHNTVTLLLNVEDRREGFGYIGLISNRGLS